MEVMVTEEETPLLASLSSASRTDSESEAVPERAWSRLRLMSPVVAPVGRRV